MALCYSLLKGVWGMGMDHDIQSVEEYLLERAKETLFLPADLGFYDFPEDFTLEDLISTFPGSDKSKTATAIANRYWEEKGRPTLYLMPTHKEISDRLKFIGKDGNSANWEHYEGHKPSCIVSEWADIGYSGVACDCGRGEQKFDHNRPTLAALDVVLTDHTTRYSAHDNAPLFPLWIIDEIDFGRFVIQKHVRRADIVKVAVRYPLAFKPVRLLSKVLADLIDRQVGGDYPETLNGQELYAAISDVLAEKGTTLQKLLDDLRSLPEELPSGRWANTAKPQTGKPTLIGQPRNFPRFLVPVLVDELSNYLTGNLFNPRIHLVDDGNRDPLQIRWRREVIDEFVYEREKGLYDHIQPQFMILDASADIQLLETMFADVAQKYTPQTPEWPCNVHVHQWAKSTVSKGELGLSATDDSGTGSNAKLEVWLNRIEDSLKGFDWNLSVGIITHKEIEPILIDGVKSLGFKSVKSMHFFSLLGSNAFEESKILVILGCPIPNLTGFQEECQAFFHDYPKPLEFKPTNHKAELEMRDGRKYPVKEFGYGDNSVSAYYQQKSHAELYQALHRIRSYILRKYDRHILLFTNKPVDGVKVKQILVDEESWVWRVASIVQTRLEATDGCEAKALASQASEPQEKPESVRRRIQRNGEAIAILAGAWYKKGKTGPGGEVARFVRLGPID